MKHLKSFTAIFVKRKINKIENTHNFTEYIPS